MSCNNRKCLRIVCALLATSLYCAKTLAEYRVYQYSVSNKITFFGERLNQIVSSTLNPRAYVAYHGGAGMISVDLLRTWICPGNTRKKKICPSPYGQLSQLQAIRIDDE